MGMAVTILSMLMPSFSQDLPSWDKRGEPLIRSDDGGELKEEKEEEEMKKKEEEEEEFEEACETCSDVSCSETEEEVDGNQIWEQGNGTNDDIEEFRNHLLIISPDIFSYHIRTSFVNNKDARGAHWFDNQLRRVNDLPEREMYTNCEEQSDEDSSDDEDTDNEENKTEDSELDSVLQSWDWPQQLLWTSVICGDEADVVEALRSGASLTRTNPWGDNMPALLLASGRHHIVQLLLRSGAEPRTSSSTSGLSALEVAVEKAYKRIISTLLEGANGDIYWLIK